MQECSRIGIHNISTVYVQSGKVCTNIILTSEGNSDLHDHETGRNTEWRISYIHNYN